MMDDADLARAAQTGEAAAFEELLARHGPRLLAFLRRRTGSDDAAEDVAQEVWVAVHRHLQRYDPRRPFRAWLYAIARRAGIDAWRRRPPPAEPVAEADWVDRRHPGDGAARPGWRDGSRPCRRPPDTPWRRSRRARRAAAGSPQLGRV